MNRTKTLFIEITGHLFIFLFLYTAYSKLAEHQKFADVLATSPLIGSALSEWVAWGVPVVEIAISLLLLFPLTKIKGLYAAVSLMTVFTVYLTYMIINGSKLPCQCGGAISNLTWQQHIWFNLFFIAIGMLTLYFNRHYKRTNKNYTNTYAV